MFLDALDRILAGQATSAAIRHVEAGASAAHLWRQIADAGFLDLMLPEADGGAALLLPELFPILACLGRHAIPLPVAQSIAARALVGTRGRLPAGMLTLATQLQRSAGGRLCCPQTPCGAIAEHVLVADGDALLLLPCANAVRDVVGDPRSLSAHLTWADPSPSLVLASGGQHLEAFAAALMAAMLSGAMHRTFEMALAQCNNRVQFGRTIGKFQAVQHQVSVMAEHVLAASIAAEAAFRGTGASPRALAAAVAKSRAGEAAAKVAATAHAVHGAIGMTDDCDLGLLTRRLHDWRLAYGGEHHWNRTIGELVLGADESLADLVLAV
jgi:alkylation response protein AidB-like acyl-CoA dehydrogenase